MVCARFIFFPSQLPSNSATLFTHYSVLSTRYFFMRVILQRVRRGSVTVDGRVTGAIDNGFVALVGVTHGDSEAQAELLARKTANSARL